jgi:hypothetical protein
VNVAVSADRRNANDLNKWRNGHNLQRPDQNKNIGPISVIIEDIGCSQRSLVRILTQIKFVLTLDRWGACWHIESAALVTLGRVA